MALNTVDFVLKYFDRWQYKFEMKFDFVYYHHACCSCYSLQNDTRKSYMKPLNIQGHD